jgi:hypothetical protein
MSLIQVCLKNICDIKIKDIFLEINSRTKFSDIITKSSNIIGPQYLINHSKIVINDYIYTNFLNNFILDFVKDNNIDYYEFDDIEFILFVDIKLPKLLSHPVISNFIKKHI